MIAYLISEYFEHEAVKVAPEGEAKVSIFTRLCAEIVERRAHVCN